jgi:exodeoxyribonuclease VIII
MLPLTGIHKGLEDAHYRNSEGLSQSSMKSLAKSPAHFRHQLENQITATPAMLMGRLFHHLALTPDVAPWWAVKPDGMSFSTKEGKAWRETAQGDVVTTEQWQQALGMSHAIHNHGSTPTFTDTELSVFGEIDGVKVKARLDALAGDIWDLKSTDDARPESFAKSIFDYGYHIQAALYLDLYNANSKSQANGFYFIAVESKPPHGCRIYRLSDESVAVGRDEYQRLIGLYKTCKNLGCWPCYTDEVAEIGLPKWVTKKQTFEDLTK